MHPPPNGALVIAASTSPQNRGQQSVLP